MIVNFINYFKIVITIFSFFQFSLTPPSNWLQIRLKIAVPNEKRKLNFFEHLHCAFFLIIYQRRIQDPFEYLRWSFQRRVNYLVSPEIFNLNDH